jgi:hypothetical protein
MKEFLAALVPLLTRIRGGANEDWKAPENMEMLKGRETEASEYMEKMGISTSFSTGPYPFTPEGEGYRCYLGNYAGEGVPYATIFHELGHYMVSSRLRPPAPNFGLGADPLSGGEEIETQVSSEQAHVEEFLAALLSFIYANERCFPFDQLVDLNALHDGALAEIPENPTEDNIVGTPFYEGYLYFLRTGAIKVDKGRIVPTFRPCDP